MTTSSWRDIGRGAVFFLLLAFMLWGPFYKQVLHGDSRLFRPWIMFRDIGVGVVDARFYRVSADGQRELLDRYQLVGDKTRHEVPVSMYRLHGWGTSVRVGQMLCRQLGPDADVRVESRVATRVGWRAEEDGLWNVCQGRGVYR